MIWTHHPTLRMTARAAGACILLMGSSLFIPNCATTVGEEEVAWSVSVTGTAEDQAMSDATSFTTDKGWRVELTQAQLLVGPIYMYSGEARASLLERLLGPNQAYACAAHAQFQSGETLGEIPMQYGVDLTDGTTRIVEQAIGEAGTVQSVELHLQNPGQVDAGNALARDNLPSTFVFAGTATKDGEEVPFAGELTLPEEGAYQIVDSIPANFDLSEGAEVELRVAVDRWFANVDFSTLEQPSDADGVATISPGTQAYSALTFATRSRANFTWTTR